MRSTSFQIVFCLLLAACLLTGCGGAQTESAPADLPTEAPPAASGTPAPTEPPAAPTELPAAPTEPPVTAESLREGVYPVTVESGYPLFQPDRAELTVMDGRMTAQLCVDRDAYSFLFDGTAAEASAAPEEDLIPLEPAEEQGSFRFIVDVAALDTERPFAVFGGKQGGWNDCALCFRSDSLPLEAFAEDALVTPESLGLGDGEYTVDVFLRGGSGKAKVLSPAVLTIRDGTATARIVWGSSNYDFMVLDGERILPETFEGGSTFLLPVLFFDRPIAVSADTTAMSTPHLIDYTLRFDSASIRAGE